MKLGTSFHHSSSERLWPCLAKASTMQLPTLKICMNIHLLFLTISMQLLQQFLVVQGTIWTLLKANTTFWETLSIHKWFHPLLEKSPQNKSSGGRYCARPYQFAPVESDARMIFVLKSQFSSQIAIYGSIPVERIFSLNYRYRNLCNFVKKLWEFCFKIIWDVPSAI